MDMDTHSAGLAWSGASDNALPVPESSAAMNGNGADVGTGQGSGEEHINFGHPAKKSDENDPAKDTLRIADSFSEFSEPDSKDESVGASLL
ncbi:MAG: hypothetical protein HGB37_04835 [Candidatus Moranbacteria bacterium]|nr:hypothetical protein [Candidatus Moranbacteria bacterium]NTW90202.1 hypothetical protein [Candidatus Moranbacteria bacterium]